MQYKHKIIFTGYEIDPIDVPEDVTLFVENIISVYHYTEKEKDFCEIEYVDDNEELMELTVPITFLEFCDKASEAKTVYI